MAISHENLQVTSPFPFWFSSWYPPHNSLQRIYVAAHWHQGIEVNYTYRGRIADFFVGSHHFQCTPGDILVVNSQEIHGADGYLGEDDAGVDIIYPYTLIKALFPPLDRYLIKVNDPTTFSNYQHYQYSKLQELLESFVKEVNTPKAPQFQNLTINSLGMTILSTLMSSFAVKKPSITSHQSYKMERLLQITENINLNFRDPLTLGSIAKQCGVTKEYLATFFKKMMGLTVGQYINNVRAQNSYPDLISHNDTLTNIAINNGFSGVRTMNRAVKAIYGKTASELYKSHR